MGRGEVTPVALSHKLLIQCGMSCEQSDLTQPEIHMTGLYLGLIYSFGELELPKPMAGYVPVSHTHKTLMKQTIVNF